MTTSIITGPTASGKSAFALEKCTQDSTFEIINADSLQQYRGLDIGTAKPSREEQARVPHHVLDTHNPDQQATVQDWLLAVQKAESAIHARGHHALIVGGSIFYLKAYLFGLWDAPPTDPDFRAACAPQSTEELFAKLGPTAIHPHDRYRIIRALEIMRHGPIIPHIKKDSRVPLLILDCQDTARIQERTRSMLDKGLIEEVLKLKPYWQSRPLQSVGYKETINYLQGIKPVSRSLAPGTQGLIDEIVLATRQLAKKQRTFLKNLAATYPF